MTPVPVEWDKGTVTPAERSALVSSLLVVLGCMRDAGMVGGVISVVDGELSDAFNRAVLAPPQSLRLLAEEALRGLK